MRAETATREKLVDNIKSFDTAMLVTRSSTGGLRARPMAIADVQPAGGLWFVTSAATEKIHEIADRSEVNVSLQSSSVYVSVTGTARTVRNPTKIRELWKEAWRVWFPDGPDESDLVLINVEPTSAEFWDNRGTKGVRYLWEAAKAYVKGERVDDSDLPPAHHGKVEL